MRSIENEYSNLKALVHHLKIGKAEFEDFELYMSENALIESSQNENNKNESDESDSDEVKIIFQLKVKLCFQDYLEIFQSRSSENSSSSQNVESRSSSQSSTSDGSFKKPTRPLPSFIIKSSSSSSSCEENRKRNSNRLSVDNQRLDFVAILFIFPNQIFATKYLEPKISI